MKNQFVQIPTPCRSVMIAFTDEELLVLTTALGCTAHLLSSTFQQKLAIQNDMARRVLRVLSEMNIGDACATPAHIPEVSGQGGTI